MGPDCAAGGCQPTDHKQKQQQKKKKKKKNKNRVTAKPAVAWCSGSFNSSSIRQGSRLRRPGGGGGQPAQITAAREDLLLISISTTIFLHQGLA